LKTSLPASENKAAPSAHKTGSEGASIADNRPKSSEQLAIQRMADSSAVVQKTQHTINSAIAPVQRKLIFTDTNEEYTDAMAFLTKYWQTPGVDKKQLEILNMIQNGEHSYTNIGAMLTALNSTGTDVSSSGVAIDVKESLKKVLVNPFEGENTEIIHKGVSPLLHTVWVGGAITGGAKENIASWALSPKMQVILWMDKKAASASGVRPSSGTVKGIHIGGLLLVDPVKDISVPVALTGQLPMGGELHEAAGAEAEYGRPQVASDILRIGILHTYGGIYMDVGGVSKGVEDIDPEEVEFSGSMDVQPGFHAETNHMENGLIIAQANSPILKKMLFDMTDYYGSDPERRIREEAEELEQLLAFARRTKFVQLEQYLTWKVEADRMASVLVNMPPSEYLTYMQKPTESPVHEIMKRWKGYIDHLRQTPLTLLTDSIRPEELREVGASVSGTINHATMLTFQDSIEQWKKLEESSGRVLEGDEVLKKWNDFYKGRLLNYGQKGYSWMNPGLSAAEERERLAGKSKPDNFMPGMGKHTYSIKSSSDDDSIRLKITSDTVSAIRELIEDHDKDESIDAEAVVQAFLRSQPYTSRKRLLRVLQSAMPEEKQNVATIIAEYVCETYAAD